MSLIRELPTLRQTMCWVQERMETSEDGEMSVSSSVLDGNGAKTIAQETGLYGYYAHYKSKFLFTTQELSCERCKDDNLVPMKG